MAETIFITGATGFIGSQVAKYALQAGYKVRLSIRRPEQEQSIRSFLKGHDGKIEFVHVPDLAAAGAFDKALAGVQHIFHLASPLPGKGDDVHKDYVEPAVQGTLNILKEAKKHDQIKFVIVTSSVLGLLPPDGSMHAPVRPKANTGERIPVNLDVAWPEGFAGHGRKYSSSKILAHQATRDFLRDDAPHYKLVTFHPVFVLGESLVQTSAQADGMNAVLLQSLGCPRPFIASSFVDVKQCAEAHIKALQNYQSLKNGTEYILASPAGGWDEVADLVRQEYPQVKVALEKGPFIPQDTWEVDTEPAESELGIKWRPAKDIVRETISQQLAFQKSAQL